MASKMKDKTVFIYVNQGFAIRYLLRSSILPTLAENIRKVVILSHNGNEVSFKKAFESENIIVEQVKIEHYESHINSSKLLRLLIHLRSFILNGNANTKTIDDFRKIFLHEKGWTIKNGFIAWLYGFIWNLLCYLFKKNKLLRRLIVIFESKYFVVAPHTDLFENYSPD